MKLIKRILAWCIALTLMLSALPTITVKSGATSYTKVESKLDFTGMTTYGEGRNDAQTAENKEKVRQTLLAAGAVECENLFLKGNMETIVNPGGYRGAGYYIQKVTAAEGETIQDATLNFGYWITTNSTQGYIEVYVSADNAQYEKIYEQREGNGAAFTNSRREETIDLPFAEDQTEIYVKFVMEHWDTYEGAGIAYSTLTISTSQDVAEDPGTSEDENTKVQNTYSFETLPSGEVTAEDIGAIEESNLYYGKDGVALLSPRNGYEEASATWLIEAAEGEKLEDCVLTIVGRTAYNTEEAKNGNYLKVSVSTDGMSYTLVKEFRANENQDDNQELAVDLTDAVKGSEKAYVKLEWLVFDAPYSFGIRSVTLTGNENSPTEPETPTEPEEPSGDLTKVESKLDFTGMPTYGEGRNDAQTAENKEKVRQTLLAAGAVECDNLFLKGNMETIVNPGGYRNAGYYIQKVTAAEGETIRDAILNFGYWITTNSTQGYIEVYVSADNVQYEKIYEQREGNGAAFTNTRREETVDLPFAEDQTEIYVKFVMEHWDTYEGAGIAYSTLTVNASQNTPEDPSENTKVESTYSFDALPSGEVTAEDIGAIEESNLYYGKDGVALLSPRNGYEEASATWLIEAAEGEKLEDCVLTIVGRTAYNNEEAKNGNYLKVSVSTDGMSYTLVKEFRANENQDDNQELTVDLTDAVKGSEKAYVKLEWLVFDAPYSFGIRSVTLTANDASAEPETPTEPETTVTKVESKLDFTGMPTYGEGKNDAQTAENKEKVRQTLLAAGAVECDNLFLKGNMETIVNPGGYRNAGYYIQKVTAAEGETIQDATLNFGYWLTTNSTQGYIEVYVSADNAQYEKIYEQREGNGAAFTNSRREETIDLPFAEDQTEIYVKFVMEHWDTYEGAGIAYSTLTVNAAQDKPEDPGTPVQNTYSFDDLPSGEVTAEDIGAIEESNLYYGKDGVALLSPRNGYEEASATWLIETAEGEDLKKCVLTIVGRTAYNNEEAKNGNYLKVFASTDGTSYTLVKEFRANENQDDNQELTVDLTDAVKGSEKAYVKLQWLVFDAPYSFGIRSVTLTGNDDGEGDTEGSDPSLDFDKAPEDCKLIKHTYIFDKLPKGEVSAGAIGAIHESNLYFGIDGVPLLSPRNGYEIASATWLLEAAEGEPLHNCLINIVGRTFYITESVKNDNYLKVYASPDGVNYTLVKEFRANSNPDFSQNFLVDLSDAVKGSGKAYIKLEWLVFDSPHIFGIRGITLVGNSIGKNVSFGIGGGGSKKPVDLSIPHEECMKVELSQNFNTLTAGEVTAEDLGAVDEMNMYFGIDGVPLLSPRNGYEIASATWKLETEGKDPLHDCVLTIVGRTFYVSESVKNDNYLKVYASADGVNYTLVKEFRSNDNPDDTQRFTVDLTDVVKGNGQAYVKLEWLVFDSPHIFGIRSITLTGNTAGIDNSGGASAKVAITNIQNFSQLSVGPADKDALFAHKSANLCYGYNNIGLLTASEAGEDAYVTWVLNAKEGEPFEDCYLTLIGRCGYINQELAEKSEWRIQFSSDGENYSTVTTLKPTEPAGDLQSFVIDLSAQSFGLNKIYVRLYWKSLDDPSGMGLRAMSMVANAGEDYALFTPNVLSDKLTIDAGDAENIPIGSEDVPTDSQQKEGKNNALAWIIAGGAVVAAVIAAAVVISLKKRSRRKADKKDASI